MPEGQRLLQCYGGATTATGRDRGPITTSGRDAFELLHRISFSLIVVYFREWRGFPREDQNLFCGNSGQFQPQSQSVVYLFKWALGKHPGTPRDLVPRDQIVRAHV